MPVGHKQFTEIARELSKEHLKLLILDEPTAVLTEKEAAALLDSIRSMSARGIAGIFITHRLQEILDVCDKVIIMRDGHVVKDTPAKETDVSDITRWMVGRSVDLSAAQDVVDHSGAKTIMSIRKLWVDMPGEIVRNVDLDIREGEILGGRHRRVRRQAHSAQRSPPLSRRAACLCVGGPPRCGPAARRVAGVEHCLPGHADPR